MVPGLNIAPQKERHVGRWIALAVFIFALTLASWTVYKWYMTGEPLPISIPIAKANPAVDESEVSPQAIDTYTVPAEQPRYITIPSLGVNRTRVYAVGLTANNILDTPRNIHDAAWYKNSQTPGTGYGAVLINAHSGGVTKDGVFAELSTLKQDDEIIVERGDGNHFAYRVVENQTMDLDEVNRTGMKTLMKSADSSKEGLSLITCAGKWVPRIGQFDKRVMIRAVAVTPDKDATPEF